MVNNTANFIAGFGFIPSDWSCKSANEICTKISKGTTPPKSEISDMGEIPFLRVNNLTFKGRLAPDSDFIYVSKDAHENFLARSMAFPNDILMNIVGPPLGKTALLDDKYSEYNMNQAIVFYRLKKELVNSQYFLDFLNSSAAQQWLQSRSKKTSGQQNLTIELCKELPIILPPLVEQNEIARILSTWDQAIVGTEKLLENSQLQKKSLMQQLLSGKKRLLDESGLNVTTPWEKYRLGMLLKEEKQRNKHNSISRVLSVTNHSGFVLPENQFSKRIASDEVSNYKIVRKGQFGYNPSRINVGSFARLDQFENGLLSPMYVVFSIKSEKLDSDFFLYWMKSNEAKQRINNSTQGSVRDSVGFDAISSFVLKLPEIQEQRKIAKVLYLADQEIETLQKKLDCLKQEKKALMQQLLTGKKRVKVAA